MRDSSGNSPESNRAHAEGFVHPKAPRGLTSFREFRQIQRNRAASMPISVHKCRDLNGNRNGGIRLTARGLLWLAILALLGGASFWGWQHLESNPPVIMAPESILLGSDPQSIEIGIQDPDSGLRVVSVRLLAPSGSRSLLDQTYPGHWSSGGGPGSRSDNLNLLLDANALQVPDGPATLVIDTRDWSWRDGLTGNRTELSIPVVIDTKPPQVRVESGLTYMYRGGSAAAVYKVEEESTSHGVQVGEAFFPGWPHPAGGSDRRVALFAVPVETPQGTPVEIIATDAAGNRRAVPFPARVLERVFRESELPLSNTFIAKVAEPLAQRARLDSASPAATFRAVNETLRAQNEATIRESLSEPSPQPLWQGAFQQWPGSQVMSRFAEDRTYVYQGEPISEARHYGFDLAATARAPVSAAGAGQVVLAGDLGIYGLCVIIDHGLGLASLYGHLSTIDVSVGEEVRKGQRIGRSGETGLAAGDHLHFAFLIGDHYVDPLEWWDPKWVRSHIGVRLERSDR